MQTITQPYPIITRTAKETNVGVPQGKKRPANHTITGRKQRFIRSLIWLNILWIAIRTFKNPLFAFEKVKELKALRSKYRNQRSLSKYVESGKRYFVNFNTPGWPSVAFSRYVKHYFGRIAENGADGVYTLVFGITKKCGFQCEHCFEWLNLNKPETLSREDLVEIVNRFHSLGVAQVQLSGGEPLNRFQDILYLLDHAPAGIDFWLYTSGYSLSQAKAATLKQHGLTGVIVSLDHHDEEKHNTFRGVKDSYEKALSAVLHAGEAGLATCFSLCATKEFISEENLCSYLDLAKQYGVSFIQILEPRAVGHYTGKDVTIAPDQQKMLEQFFEAVNYDPGYTTFPAIAYHSYTSRQFGCSGGGMDYVYADTDGDIHKCTFCQKKLFSAFDKSFPVKIRPMTSKGCAAFSSCPSK